MLSTFSFRRRAVLAACVWSIGVLPVAGQMPPMGGGQPAGGAQMPDAKAMSGMPLPAGDVAVGTVTVRVVRGSMANVVPDQAVELLGGTSPVTVKTNDTGRAEFAGLTPGMKVKAVTTVNGERLESQEITVPPTGGIRVALVATDPDAAKKAAEDRKLAATPAQPGIVVLGDQSRFVFEMGEEGLNVFNLFEIVNTARTPVQPATPVVFDPPAGARGVGVLDGSSPQATVSNGRVVVAGPFAPGNTVVQFAYSIPLTSADLTIAQPLPVALNQVSVMAQKAGDTHLTSPQLSQHQDMSGPEGQTFIVGQGPALKAGDTITFNFTGLPHDAVWPRNLALTLALVVLGGGLWGAAHSGKAAAEEQARRRKLQAKRDKLFTELTSLEEQHRAQAIDAAVYAARRRDLVTALERVYAEMDEEAAA